MAHHIISLSPFGEQLQNSRREYIMAEKQKADAFVQALSITRAQAGVRAMTAQEIVQYAKEVAQGIRQVQGYCDGSMGAIDPAVDPKDAGR